MNMQIDPTMAPRMEFQAVLRLVPSNAGGDSDLEQLAERSVEALQTEGAGLALGVVASVDLDQRIVELEMTIEASSDSEVHQKMGLILSALERGVPLKLRESTASRTPDRELVCA